MKKLKPEHVLVAIAVGAAIATCVAVWNLYVWVPL